MLRYLSTGIYATNISVIQQQEQYGAHQHLYFDKLYIDKLLKKLGME